MTTEFRCFGPPGTGKTHWLSRQISRAAVKYQGTGHLLIASFTKTAAEEIIARAEINKGPLVGTLHSICYKMLGTPKIAETMVDDWNQFAADSGFRGFAMSSGSEQVDDPTWGISNQRGGDKMLSEVNILRSRKVPRQMWRADLVRFDDLWQRFKDDTDSVDFTDMIERMVGSAPPRGAEIGFFDEAQDFTALELDLVRGWSEYLDYIVLVGDDDQCIYDFKGATPDAFLDPPVDEKYKTVLKKSVRVPRAVHAMANKWIGQIKVREPKHYEPADRDGEVRRLPSATWKHPGPIIDEIAAGLDSGKTFLIEASCSYMLTPTIAALRDAGIPFHNPYRVARGDWNPIRTGGKRTSTADRLLAWLRADDKTWGDDWRQWTVEDVQRFASHLKAGGFLARGAKQLLKRLVEANPNQDAFLVDGIFESQDVANEAWQAAFDVDLSWLDSRLLSSKQQTWEYPMRIVESLGGRALLERPRVTIGTIHSFKGAEADTVYLFPDISAKGAALWASDQRDSIIRLFYVAMTRAKDTLVICGKLSRASVPL